jgi:hypothetical protein
LARTAEEVTLLASALDLPDVAAHGLPSTDLTRIVAHSTASGVFGNTIETTHVDRRDESSLWRAKPRAVGSRGRRRS